MVGPPCSPRNSQESSPAPQFSSLTDTDSESFFFFFNTYLFGFAGPQSWHTGCLVVACKFLVEAVGSSSLTRDPSRAPCLGITGSQPLDHQGSSWSFLGISVKSRSEGPWLVGHQRLRQKACVGLSSLALMPCSPALWVCGVHVCASVSVCAHAECLFALQTILE